MGRPYDVGPYVAPEHQLKSEEKFLNVIKEIQNEVPNMIVIATGFTWFRDFAPYITAAGLSDGWFKIAGFGRQAFAYPDFARDILEKGKMDRNKCCITCSKCTEIMRNVGTSGCVVRDSEMYLPIYKKFTNSKNL